MANKPPPPSSPSIQMISSHQPESGFCPHCHQPIVTRLEKASGVVVWLASFALCFFGCVLGCCLIPFCLDGLKV
jgi:lipopolysaccharide-induced tumor necrosis factor-alpha factor